MSRRRRRACGGSYSTLRAPSTLLTPRCCRRPAPVSTTTRQAVLPGLGQRCMQRLHDAAIQGVERLGRLRRICATPGRGWPASTRSETAWPVIGFTFSWLGGPGRAACPEAARPDAAARVPRGGAPGSCGSRVRRRCRWRAAGVRVVGQSVGTPSARAHSLVSVSMA